MGVGKRTGAVPVVKSWVVSWGLSACTDFIAIHLSRLVSGGSLHGVNGEGAASCGTGTGV
ncbi:MAG: hypothetical protein KGS09_04385 [Nitrospirae bacterium]|nr:hypothetical protein [Nitrospirota bacterium]